MQSAKGNILALVLAGAGALVASTTLLAPIHERGHYNAAKMQGIRAVITDWNHCRIDEFTPWNLAAGYEAETTQSFFVFVALFFIMNPRAVSKWRRFYWLSGFPLGYATWSWLTPLIQDTKDFTIVPAWTNAMRHSFLVYPGLLVLLGWVVFFWFRLRSANKLPLKVVQGTNH